MNPHQHNQQQQTQLGFSTNRKTFWTACTSCNVRFLYYRDIVNRALICQSCKKPFIACDVGAQGMPSRAKKELFSEMKECLSRDDHKMVRESNVEEFPSSMEVKANHFDNVETVLQPLTKRAGESIGGDSKTKVKEGVFVWELDSDDESSSVEEVPRCSFSKSTECENSGIEAAAEDDNQDGHRAANESEPIVGAKTIQILESIDVPDPEFHDFDTARKEECFEVGQIWAIYDDLDGMPRYYARIKQVYSPSFKVQITWLDSYSGGQSENDWIRKRLPVACGKFRNEKTLDTDNIAMFSHKLDLEKASNRGPYMIYPRKGETWALFKNWDINWSSDSDQRRNYEYEFVEVQSDYTKESGVGVVYLIKIEGFVSLFKPTINDGMASFQIPPNELLRFAHRVPSFRMTGTERKDVPEGSFELDPACLPHNLKATSDHIDGKVNTESINTKINGASKSLEDFHTPKKRQNPEENNTMDRRNLRSGNWFQRSADVHNERRTEESAGYTLDKTFSGSDGLKTCDTSPLGRESTLTFQADVKEMGSDGVDANIDTVAEQTPSSLSDPTPAIPEAVFYNFYDDKSDEKFQPGQVWSLYCNLDDLPKYYAQIERVELYPVLKVYIKWLESCDPPKGVIPWLDRKIPVCCGTFKVASGETAVLNDSSSFSHQLKGVSSDKNIYKIYPREGEVWSLYKNFNSDLKRSGLRKCKYDMVEVLKVYHANWIIVLGLRQVTCFKTVFNAEKEAGNDLYMAIPWIELFRFSHQVPAFRLTGANHGSLRGCWELDPKSTPVCLFSSN